MGTLPLSQTLAGQHLRIDQGVKGIVDGDGSLAALATSLALLRLHLYLEETHLFPPLMKAGLVTPVFVLKREHGQMWPLLESLSAACITAAPVATLQGPARQLFQLLRIHNTKEEQIVYAAADHLADEAATQAVVHDKIPADWICATARH